MPEKLPPLKLRPPVAGGNGWCGPAVVSSLTGVTGADAARVMRAVTGKRAIKGTYISDVERTLRKFGIGLRLFIDRNACRPKHRETLAAVLKRIPRPAGKIYLISAGHHWQLVSGRSYVCGRIGEVVSVRDPRVKRRARVRGVWEVYRTGPPTVPTCLAPAPPPDPKRRECLKLARRLGCEIDVDTRIDVYWVYGPDEIYGTGPGDLERPDPREGEHACADWGEVWDALNDYKADLVELGPVSDNPYRGD